MDEAGTVPEAEEPDAATDASVVSADAADEAAVTEAVLEDAGVAPSDDEAAASLIVEPDVEPTLDEMVAELAGDADMPEQGEELGESARAEPAVTLEPVASEEDQEPGAPSAEAEPAAEPEQATEPAPEAEPEAAEPADVEPGDQAETEKVSEEPVEETTAPEAEPVEAPVAPPEPRPLAFQLWTRGPLWVVAFASLVVVGVLTYLLWPFATGIFITHPLYRLLVFGGAGLVLIDLLTGLVIWLSARSHASDDEKVGLARTIWMRTLAWTAGGVALWWVGLILLDLRHSGLLG